MSRPQSHTSKPRISIIVPTLNEAGTLGELLADVARIGVATEVIVVDGGSTDGTTDIALSAGAQLIRHAPGRGRQLGAGALAATADLLCFLHADVRLADDAIQELTRLAGERSSRPDGGAFAFRLRIDSSRRVFRLVEWGANVRSQLAGLPYGDQGLIVSRSAYRAAGGYPPIGVMEDVALAIGLRRQTTPVRLLPSAARVSPRRWERDGVLRRTLTNWALLVAYLAGIPPARLERWYRTNLSGRTA
ncbi:MAG: TIGR04283 family arsenosugar biosynthesis glycosyltransferase [Gemmatimonadaceae bacterium]